MALASQPANVLNPGVGRLRRAEAEIWGVKTMGAWVGPLFFVAQPLGANLPNPLQKPQHQRNYHAPTMRDDFPAAC